MMWPETERIGLESGPLSIWLCHGLTALGLPVVCLDARHAQAALKLQLNKSDANDARGLIVRTGWYREVAVKSLDGQLVRALITARAQLVAQRVDLGNQILLKPFGLLAGKGVGKTFAEKAWSPTVRCTRSPKPCSGLGKPSTRRAPETVGQLRLRQRVGWAEHRWRAWPDTRW
jgi:transposase